MSIISVICRIISPPSVISVYGLFKANILKISDHICFDASHVNHAENMIIKFHDNVRCGIDLYMTFYIMLVNIICIVPVTMLSQSYIFLSLI